jgi:calcium-dependent protein kinase
MAQAANNDSIFEHITQTFSTTDIRSVYDFKKMIGGGHFGTVRTATLKSDPQATYAIKSILRENIAKDIRLLEEELAILQAVDHPNIVKFDQCYVDHRYVHIVMEYCNGGELFDRIVAAQRFSERHAADVMSQMLSSIKHLHGHGIVHRDLKPENFLMNDPSENSEVKLIDFGLSKRFSAKKEVEKMHTVVGTPYYVAPEVLKGNYDISCDIWSLGVILYVFLCGYPPFEGDNNKEIFRNVLKQRLQFDPAEWSTISDSAKDLVSKMLNKDPKKRISATQCLEHPWFTSNDIETNHAGHDPILLNTQKLEVLRRIKNFRSNKRLQIEALTFLVSQSDTSQFDFDLLRNAFRTLDEDNSGTLQLCEIR